MRDIILLLLLIILLPRTSHAASTLWISSGNIQPSGNIWLQPGDWLNVQFQGTPQCTATARISDTVNLALQETTSYQIITKPPFCESNLLKHQPSSGLYQGGYRIQPTDRFINHRISVSLKKNNQTLNDNLPATLTTLDPALPHIAIITTTNAVIRTSPMANRLTPLPAGVKLHLTGQQDHFYRFYVGDSELWIETPNVMLMAPGTPVPESTIYQVLCQQDPTYLTIQLPLSETLPYTLTQLDLTTLRLEISQAKINVDFIQYPPSNTFLDQITWEQKKNSCVLIIKTKQNPIRGFDIDYNDHTLRIKLKRPVKNKSMSMLANKIIILDPGHGDEADGAVGLTGIKEKTINLAIAHYLKAELEKHGAKVWLTRENDQTNPSFERRVQLGKNHNADLLISIHNNALPDGRDPLEEHGSSTYYYHPQALPLARFIQAALLQELGFDDYGVYWANLVMTRPTLPVAVLVESGFMIHPDEYQKLITPRYQKKTAIAIEKGIEQYFHYLNE